MKLFWWEWIFISLKSLRGLFTFTWLILKLSFLNPGEDDDSVASGNSSGFSAMYQNESSEEEEEEDGFEDDDLRHFMNRTTVSRDNSSPPSISLQNGAFENMPPGTTVSNTLFALSTIQI